MNRRMDARSMIAGPVLAAALLAGSGPASAQAAGEAGVTLLDDSRVRKTADLDFGAIFAGQGGTITVAPDGRVTLTGSVESLGGTQPAGFVMERRILVDYPAMVRPRTSERIQLEHEADPGTRMTVRSFTTDYNRRTTLPFLGNVPAYYLRTSYDFRIGATLQVARNQRPGNYSGTFTVDLDYE